MWRRDPSRATAGYCRTQPSHPSVSKAASDASLVTGPAAWWHGWARDDFDALAGALVAGHVIECGPQATGGLFTDWEDVPGWHDMGYPVAECRADGTATITKPPGTGGMVTTATVAEGTSTATVVYTAAATDVNGGTVTYSLTGADAASFNINASTGAVTFVASPDYETKSSY